MGDYSCQDCCNSAVARKAEFSPHFYRFEGRSSGKIYAITSRNALLAALFWLFRVVVWSRKCVAAPNMKWERPNVQEWA